PTRHLLHPNAAFPSKLPSAPTNGVPRPIRQPQRYPTAIIRSHPIFLRVEEELHDARRLSNLLSEAYRVQADLEVQLNVAKSNLQLDVGWRRSSARESVDSTKKPRSSLDRSHLGATPPPPPPPPSQSQSQDNRFFKFRFNSSSTSNSRTASRPENSLRHPVSEYQSTPHIALDALLGLIPSHTNAKQKAALEDELESLSQALFEEANKMVADERKARAETEEELKELKLEKEALRSALRLIDGENAHLRGSSSTSTSASNSIKSRPESLDLSFTYPPLPASPAPDRDVYSTNDDDAYPSDTLPLPLHTTTTHSSSSLSSSSSASSSALSPGVVPPFRRPGFRLTNMPLPLPSSLPVGPSGQDELFLGASPWLIEI
ncbi:hypothetical protein CPB84DRAFT_1796295, partial [Gymnopilus junonius]